MQSHPPSPLFDPGPHAEILCLLIGRSLDKNDPTGTIAMVGVLRRTDRTTTVLQLHNDTPFVPAMSVFPNRDGVDTLYVVVKGTFDLSPRLLLSAKPVAPVLTDQYWGDPASSSLRYASELHIGKSTTDVILVGNAWAPGGRPVREMSVTVNVAGRTKTIRVVGDRVWKHSGFSSAEAFESMPLTFERAFGGQHVLDSSGTVMAEERNPVGVGFLGKRSRGEVVGHKLPNLEDPEKPLASAGDLQRPACFGFVSAGWLPRRRFAGTYGEEWIRTRAPYLPPDFDPRFFNTAAPELTMDRSLSGGEPVEVLGCSRQGPLKFRLPSCRPRAAVTVAGAREQPEFALETILIEPDENRVCLSWRAEVRCDKKMLKVEKVNIDAIGMDGLSRSGA
jgi:hypothetical protein